MQIAGGGSLRCAFALFALLVVAEAPAARAFVQQAVPAEETVTEPEVEQRAKFNAIIGRSNSREQVIEELRNEKRKVREAKQAGIDVLDAEVDAELARIVSRMNQTVAGLTDGLAQRGVGIETLKHRLHADMAWQRSTGTKSPGRPRNPD